MVVGRTGASTGGALAGPACGASQNGNFTPGAGSSARPTPLIIKAASTVSVLQSYSPHSLLIAVNLGSLLAQTLVAQTLMETLRLGCELSERRALPRPGDTRGVYVALPSPDKWIYGFQS